MPGDKTIVVWLKEKSEYLKLSVIFVLVSGLRRANIVGLKRKNTN